MISYRFSTALLGLLLVIAAPTAHARTVATGVYSDGLLLGFDPITRLLSGYYHSETGRGQYSCIFYLQGRLRGSSSLISTYFPEDPATDRIGGQLVLKPHRRLQVRLQSEHGGCWNVQHFADREEPAEFTLESAHAWTSIAVVKSKRAYIFRNPEGTTHLRAYVARGDGVGVLAKQPGWLKVDYIDPDGRVVSGWVRQSEVYRTN